MMATVGWPDLDFITTARCRLGPLAPQHADVMVDVLADPALYEFTGGRAPTFDQLGARYRAQSVRHSADGRQWWCNWIVVLLDQEVPVGYVQATVERSGSVLEADVAWVVRPQDQRRGLATEAARGMLDWLAQYGVERYAAYIHTRHAASARVASKLGMHRTAVTHDGETRWESGR